MDRISSDQQDLLHSYANAFFQSKMGYFFVQKHGIKSDFYADNLVRFGGGYLFNKDLQFDTAIIFFKVRNFTFFMLILAFFSFPKLKGQ